MFNFLPRGGKADSGHHSVLRTPDLYLEHSAPSPLRAAGTLEARTFAGLRESLWVVVLLLSAHFSHKSPHFLLPPVVLTTGSAAILLVPFLPFHFNWFWSVKAFSEYEFVFHWNQSFSASLLPPSFNSAKFCLPQIKWLRAEPALTWLQNYIAALMLLIWLDPVWPRNAFLAQEYGPPFAETGMLAPVLWEMDDKKNGGLSDNVGHFAKMGMKKTTPVWQQGGIGDSL